MAASADKRLQIYLAHRADLIDYATPIVGCRATAEDVVQEAFVRFSPGEGPSPRDFEQIGQPVGYLYRIVRNLALDWTRRLSSQAQRRQVGSDGGLDALPAETPSPEHEALHRQELAIVALALDELPERTRLAFELHRLDGLTLKEVAARLGISVTLTHQLVRRAITHCADRLDDAAH